MLTRNNYNVINEQLSSPYLYFVIRNFPDFLYSLKNRMCMCLFQCVINQILCLYLFTGVGFGMVLVNGMCCVYYIMVVTWSIYFIGNSFLSPLPWSSCYNWWNTENCLSDADSLQNNVTTLRSLSTYILNGQNNLTQYLVNTSTELQTKDEVNQLLNLNTTMSSEEEFWQ